MKTIMREELESEYKRITESERFPENYVGHGVMTECNFGGLIITLDGSGESCVVVRDWGGDLLGISDVLEIDGQNFRDPNDDDPSPIFTLDDETYALNDFMRIG